MRTRIAPCLLSAFAALAMMSAPASADDPAPRPLPASASPGHVLLLHKCVLTNQVDTTDEALGGTFASVLLALGDAVIPSVTGFVFDRLLEHAQVQTRARGSSTSAVSDGADDTFWLYDPQAAEGKRLTRNLGCIVFYRAPRAGAPIAADAAANLAAISSAWQVGLRDTLHYTDPRPPEIVAEFLVETLTAYNSDGQEEAIAFRLRPVTLAFGATGAQRTSSARTKDITFSVEIRGVLGSASGELTDTAIYTHDFVFPHVPIGDARAYGSVDRPISGGVGPAVALPSAMFKRNDHEYHTPIPITVSITETESETGEDLQAAVLAAIAAKKQEILTPINQRGHRAVEDVVTPETGPAAQH